jgi:hypothetical protein
MRALFLLPIFMLMYCTGTARADKPGPPSTYKTTSADGKFVFVMIAPESLEMELIRYNADHQKVVKAIRDVYSKTGLYKNDGSKEPLWTVDWYSDSVRVASDGVHLVKSGRWPVLEAKAKDKDRSITKNDLKQEAVSFFANGKLLREYSIGDLIDQPKMLPMSVSHYRWMKSMRIIEDDKQLEIITQDQNRILLELATAKIVQKKKVE